MPFFTQVHAQSQNVNGEDARRGQKYSTVSRLAIKAIKLAEIFYSTTDK